MIQILLDAHNFVPRVLTIVNEDVSGSCLWRVKWPMQALTSRGFVADWILDKDFDKVAPMIKSGRYNLVVLHRLNWNNPMELTKWQSFMDNYNMKWAYGADDNVWGTDITNPLRLPKAVADRGPEAIEQDRQDRIYTLRHADGVLVTTPNLEHSANKIGAKQAVTVPNLIDHQWFIQKTPQRTRFVGGLTVGWSGSFRPDSDIETLGIAWGILASKYPNVKFVIQGDQVGTLVNSVPSDRLIILPWVSQEEYPSILKNIDIMCCYLPANGFCIGKSPIKWIEATLGGCVSVVSDVVYGNYVTTGVNALVASNLDEWIASISTLIEHEPERRRLQLNAARNVYSNWSLEEQWPKWLVGFNKLRGIRDGWFNSYGPGAWMESSARDQAN